MIKNYLKIAWRNFAKHKLYSIINISGLALGLTTCMLIMLYVAHEYSYDKFHENRKNIFSVSGKMKMNNDSILFEQMSIAAAPILKQASPAMKSFIRMQTQPKNTVLENVETPSLKFAEDKFMFADSNFFSFFSFSLRSGNKKAVLNKPFTVVLSETAAKKYFGNENPVGKILKFNNTYAFEITGIAADAPSNSSIDFNFIASLSSMKGMKEKAYENNSQLFQFGTVKTYVQLEKPSEAPLVEKTMLSLANVGKDKGDNEQVYRLISLSDVHMNLSFGDFSNLKYLKIFPLVAALVLLLALINYMSLATARATIRAKEIGVRKVMGAARRNIASQFYIESSLYAVLAFALGCFLYRVLQPSFYNLLQLDIDATFLYSKEMIAIFAILFFVTILGAGIYPSIILSRYKPVVTLYGKVSKFSSGAGIRKFFTVLQFSISIVLILCSVIINRQLYFIRNTDTGINRENVLMVPFDKTIAGHFAAFRNDIQALPAIRQVSVGHYPLYKGYDMFFAQTKDGGIPIPIFSVDKQFIEMMDMQWKIPPLNAAELTREKKVIINEAAINRLGLSANPVGQTINLSGDTIQVTAVVKDFNFESMQKKIEPLCMFVAKDTGTFWGQVGGCLFAKINSNTNIPTVVSSIQKIYEGYDNSTPFNYSFADDAFDAQYKAEERLANLFGIFTILTIIIACMGLFGMAAFGIQQRIKEIGIRKTLGASVTGIVSMLSRDFIKPVIISIVIASPIAWWAMNKWLNDFAYKISIGWQLFAFTGIAVILIAFITVSFQAIKSAIANPVKSLRTE